MSDVVSAPAAVPNVDVLADDAQTPADSGRAASKSTARVRSTLVRQRRSLVWLPFIAILALIVLLPLVRLLTKAAEDGTDVIDRMLELPKFWSVMRNTVMLAVGSTLLALVLGTILAVCTQRVPRGGRWLFSILPIIPLVIPAVAETIGFVFLLSPRVGYVNVLLRKTPLFDHLTTGPIDVFTIQWIVILTGFSLTAFVYLFVHSSLRQMGGELQAAAVVCGASEWRTLFTITLPLLRPALVYSAAISLLLGLGQFTKPLILGRQRGIDVLTTQLWHIKEEYPIDYVLGAAMGAPLIVAGVAFVFLQRRMLGDTRRYVVVSGKARHQSVRTTWLAAIPGFLYAMVAVVLPLGALTVVALSDYWGAPIDWGSGFSLRHFRTVLDNPRTQDAIETTVRSSITALAIVLPIGFFAALALARESKLGKGWRSTIDVLATIPLAMPSAIFGFALLYAYTNPPFNLYGTTTVIIVAYVTLMIPHAMRPLLTNMVGLGSEYGEASRAAGAGPVRTALLITTPLLRSGISVAAVITLSLLFHEFSASMMVRSARVQVMGTLLFDYWTSGVYGQVAVTALLMCVVTTIFVAIAMLLGGRRALENL